MKTFTSFPVSFAVMGLLLLCVVSNPWIVADAFVPVSAPKTRLPTTTSLASNWFTAKSKTSHDTKSSGNDKKKNPRILVTPAPTQSKQPSTDSVADEDVSNSTKQQHTGDPNWIFLYPQPCACLFDNQHGASVGSMATDIPPDNCQGGYYGHASLDPEQVLREGLPQRGENWDLLRHVMQKDRTSAFRGTTKQIVYPEDGVGAASFAGEGGYVYELTCVPSWDVNKHLQGRVQTQDDFLVASGKARFGGNLVRGEHEFAVASRVPPQHIKRYGHVVQSAAGTLFVPRSAWVENPRWNPAFCKYSISDAGCQAVRTLLQELDLDGNGTIELEEFKRLFDPKDHPHIIVELDHEHNTNNNDVELLFERFDADQSGSISAEELREFLMHQDHCRCL